MSVAARSQKRTIPFGSFMRASSLHVGAARQRRRSPGSRGWGGSASAFDEAYAVARVTPGAFWGGFIEIAAAAVGCKRSSMRGLAFWLGDLRKRCVSLCSARIDDCLQSEASPLSSLAKLGAGTSANVNHQHVQLLDPTKAGSPENLRLSRESHQTLSRFEHDPLSCDY